jgi:hypothetical protein
MFVDAIKIINVVNQIVMTQIIYVVLIHEQNVVIWVLIQQDIIIKIDIIL